ncbi:MAG: hypothetical protein ACFFCO_11695 [Promethearchaeota archaeon]
MTNSLVKPYARRIAFLGFFVLLLCLTVTCPKPALATVYNTHQTVETSRVNAQWSPFPVYIHVLFLYIDFEDSIDPIDVYTGDPYFIVEVDGISRTTGQSSNVDDSNIFLGVEIPVTNKPTYQIKIQCRDDDVYPNLDDVVDISIDGTDLDIVYDQTTDSVSGDDNDFHASGEDDGSVSTDENDAEIIYDIFVTVLGTLHIALIVLVLIIVIAIIVYLLVKRRRSRQHSK